MEFEPVSIDHLEEILEWVDDGENLHTTYKGEDYNIVYSIQPPNKEDRKFTEFLYGVARNEAKHKLMSQIAYEEKQKQQ